MRCTLWYIETNLYLDHSKTAVCSVPKIRLRLTSFYDGQHSMDHRSKDVAIAHGDPLQQLRRETLPYVSTVRSALTTQTIAQANVTRVEHPIRTIRILEYQGKVQGEIGSLA